MLHPQVISLGYATDMGKQKLFSFIEDSLAFQLGLTRINNADHHHAEPPEKYEEAQSVTFVLVDLSVHLDIRNDKMTGHLDNTLFNMALDVALAFTDLVLVSPVGFSFPPGAARELATELVTATVANVVPSLPEAIVIPSSFPAGLMLQSLLTDVDVSQAVLCSVIEPLLFKVRGSLNGSQNDFTRSYNNLLYEQV